MANRLHQEDMEMEFPLDDIEQIDMEMVTSMMTAAGTGAGGMLLASVVMPNIPLPLTDEMVADYPGAPAAIKGLLASALGLLGAWGLWRVNRDAALGLAGGVGGWGLASMVSGFIDQPLTLSSFGYSPARRLSSGRRMLSQPVVEPQSRFGSARRTKALSQPIVEPESPFGSGVTIAQTSADGIGRWIS